MKEYVKPEAELIEYSLNDVISSSGEHESNFTDTVIPTEPDDGGFWDGTDF